MELDEFKNIFDSATNQPADNIILADLLNKKTVGPLPVLKKRLIISLRIYLMVPVIFGIYFYFYHLTRHNLLLWLLFIILTLEALTSFISLLYVNKMSDPKGNVKQNMLAKARLIKTLFRLYIQFNLVLYFTMVCLLELSMHNHWDYNYDTWARIPFIYRLIVYAIFLSAQYFLKKNSISRQFGQYLDKVYGLLDQMQ